MKKVILTEKEIATSLGQQFNEIASDTSSLVKKVIMFGAALAQAERNLDELGLLRNRKAGQGMRGWLAENLPNLKYTTAMRWKSLAVGAAKTLGCDEESALRVMSGETVPQLPMAEMRERVDEIVNAGTLDALRERIFGEEKKEVGRPKKEAQSARPTTDEESAKVMWARLIVAIQRDRKAFYDGAALIDVPSAKIAKDELRNLVRALDTRIKEGK